MPGTVINSNTRNLRRVYDWLYRGGQPDEQGLQELYDMGIKTVISFRWRKSVVNWEREVCERIGLKFVSIPLNYTTLPGPKHIDEFFEVIENVENQPVFVHCYHGSDRTGLMIGIYRIAREGWHVHEAYREMKMCGFHRFRIRPFKWCLWRYYSKHLETRRTL